MQVEEVVWDAGPRVTFHLGDVPIECGGPDDDGDGEPVLVPLRRVA
jgi:hypothetical protein